MKANKITFGKIRAQYEILKMRAAYILAEQSIIDAASKGIDIIYDPDTTSYSMEMGPEDFFRTEQPLNDEESLLKKAREVKKKLDDAIQDEDYTKAQMFQNILDGLEIKYNKLKGNG